MILDYIFVQVDIIIYFFIIEKGEYIKVIKINIEFEFIYFKYIFENKQSNVS